MTKEELEKEVTRLRNENLDIINKYTRFAETDRRTITDLQAQIDKMKCCGNCGNERCTSKYRGNSAYHRQADGFACADNEDWKLREIKEK